MDEPKVTYVAGPELPDRVHGDLCRLWAENLKLAGSAEEKFQWLYRDAPSPAGTVFVVRASSTDGSARIVGAHGVAVRRYWTRGRAASAGVVGDLAVDRAHRGLLPALRLVGAMREYTGQQFDFAYGLPNDKAKGVMLRSGFHVLGDMKRYACVLRHASYADSFAKRADVPLLLARAAARPSLARIGGAALDLARLSGRATHALRALRRGALVWLAPSDERIDRLWCDARAAYPIVGERTSRFLRWRYRSAIVAALLRRDDRMLLAYALLDRDASSDVVHVRDVFGHPGAIGSLFDLLLPALRIEGARNVSVRFLGAPRVERILRERGFELREDARVVVVQVGASVASERALFVAPENWHLFDVDEDV
jgi:hypothetical protein